MLKDVQVMYFDFDEMIAEVINNNLMPYGLRDKIKPIPVTSPVEMAKVMAANMNEIQEWMSGRVLSLSRDNAKQIYNMFHISQSNDKKTRAKICLLCHGVTVTDSYWIKLENDKKTWEQVNVRQNRFKEIIDIALHGQNPSITTNPICPELTTKGLFKKAWIRDSQTKELYLLKSDKHEGNINTRCEVLASKVLDCFTNVEHVQYSGRVRNTKSGKMYVDKCKNFVDEQRSFVEAREVMEYCRVRKVNYEEWALSNFGSSFANIAVVDYIIMNTDRHDNNYGFMMDNHTGNIVGMAPLFDYNLALVSDAFNTNEKAAESMSQMLNNKESIRGLARRMLPYSDIRVDFEKLREIKKHFKEYRTIYNNVIDRMNQCID